MKVKQNQQGKKKEDKQDVQVEKDEEAGIRNAKQSQHVEKKKRQSVWGCDKKQIWVEKVEEEEQTEQEDLEDVEFGGGRG